MKCCSGVVVAALLAFGAAVAPVSLAQQDSTAEMACAQQHNVDMITAERALTEHKGLTDDILCYAKCTMQSMDVLEPSGEMNVDATIKRIGLATAPPEQIAMVRALLNGCIEKTPEPESCGFGYEVIQCLMREAKALKGM